MEKMTQVKALTFVIEQFEAEMPVEVMEKLTAMKSTLEKRASKAKSADRAMTKSQRANEAYKAQIVEFLATQEAPMTISQMLKEIEFDTEFSNQKLSALVKQLVDAEVVVRIEDKRKAYFKVA